ncbi:hypothetical protein D770_07160 [Flammeovirgaceae bacterium 311]|nr:hypothetical protein D770_07160 [Flammeovirgaceae bacterium 311]
MKNQKSLLMLPLASLLIFTTSVLFAQTEPGSNVSLPLSVLELTARNQEELVVVEWTSIDEIGLSHYILQYSSDGKTYKDLLMTPSSGRAHDAAFKYTITDYPAEREHHYYRLLAVPLLGKPEEKAMVRIGQSGTQTATVYPNPAKSDRFPSIIPGDLAYQILLCDDSGKVIKEYRQKKKTNLLIPIRDIKAGMHLLRVYRQQ